MPASAIPTRGERSASAGLLPFALISSAEERRPPRRSPRRADAPLPTPPPSRGRLALPLGIRALHGEGRPSVGGRSTGRARARRGGRRFCDTARHWGTHHQDGSGCSFRAKIVPQHGAGAAWLSPWPDAARVLRIVTRAFALARLRPSEVLLNHRPSQSSFFRLSSPTCVLLYG